MTVMSVKDYLALIEHVYAKKGGIEGQRAPLKTKTAMTIRHRLVDDLKNGAVIPPIVIGLLVTPGERKKLSAIDSFEKVFAFLKSTDEDNLSIIDGMQRTTALKEAASANPKVLAASVRVEIWVTEFIASLIYRMLVLNTGQVPWEISRQLETIYGQLLKKIMLSISNEDIEIFLKDEQRRRADAGQYQSRTIVELFLVFSSRKEEVEIRDKVAEDFARLDTIETSSHSDFIDYFIAMLKCLVKLDRAFSKLERGPDAAPARFELREGHIWEPSCNGRIRCGCGRPCF